MREIKFRLILDNKIVGYEKHDMAYHHSIKQIITMHSTDNKEWWNTVHDPTKWIQHDNKEQYIETQDKNGKEIYEGDRITGENLDYYDKDQKAAVIEFNKECSAWIPFSNNGDESPYPYPKECEIIGTIHD